MTTAGTAAGWYADPADATLIRWWDGAVWTSHTQPNPAVALAAPPPAGTAMVDAPPPVAAAAVPPISGAVPLVPSAPYVPPPFADPAPAAPAVPGPRRTGTSLPISEPVRLVPPTSGSIPVTIPGFDEPLPPPRTGPEPLAVPSGGPAPLAVPSGVAAGAPQPASASTPWTSSTTFAQPTGSIDLASVDYEPMTRTWGTGRGPAAQRVVTGVTTAGAWMLALSPVLQLGLVGLGWAITSGGTTTATPIIAPTLGVVALVWIVLAVVLDYRRLGALGHEFRPSVAWILLGPFFYLMARAIHVYRTSRRGTAPTWVYLALAIVVGTAAGVGSLTLPREASLSELRSVETELTAELQAEGIDYTVQCPSQASASLGSSFVCTAYDEVGPAALIRVTWTGVGDFTYAFESTAARVGG
jgi:hypothetical protein